MSIFSKLFSGGDKGSASDHPLSSEKNVRAVIAAFDRSSASRLLQEVKDWLAEIGTVTATHGAETAYHALMQLELCGHSASAELLGNCLVPSERQSMDNLVWSTLDTYATELFAAYAITLGALAPKASSTAERSQLARGAVTAFRTWRLRKKLQHFRSRKPSAAMWKDANDLLSLLVSHELEKVLVVAFPGEPAVTPLREYQTGVYFECLPADNLPPQALEILDCFLAHCETLVFTTACNEYSTQRIDFSVADGPHAVKSDDTDGPSVRFLSTLKLHDELTDYAGRIADDHDVPPWLSSVPLNRDIKEAAFRTLSQYWVAEPPKRTTNRQSDSGELLVVMGFDVAHNKINLSQQNRHVARRADQQAEVQKEGNGAVNPDVGHMADVNDSTAPPQYQFGHNPPPSDRPIGLLFRLETAADRVTEELWHQVDISGNGFGATVPALLPCHRVGTLIAVRKSGDTTWSLGIIRRIGRDAAKRPSIGVEMLSDRASCAQANLIDKERAWTDGVDGSSGWSDILLLKPDGDEMLLPHGSFNTGQVVEAMTDAGSLHVELQVLLDRGTDYDRVKFARASTPK